LETISPEPPQEHISEPNNELTPKPVEGEVTSVPIRDCDLQRTDDNVDYNRLYDETKITINGNTVFQEVEEFEEVINVDELLPLSPAEELKPTEKKQAVKEKSKTKKTAPVPPLIPPKVPTAPLSAPKKPLPKPVQTKTDFIHHAPTVIQIPRSSSTIPSQVHDDLDRNNTIDLGETTVEISPEDVTPPHTPLPPPPSAHLPEKSPLPTSEPTLQDFSLHIHPEPSEKRPSRLCAPPKRMLKSTERKMTLRNYSMTTQTEAEVYAWNLLRKRDEQEFPDELKRIARMFWFPKIDVSIIPVERYNRLKYGL
jgi:hypothetical protein